MAKLPLLVWLFRFATGVALIPLLLVHGLTYHVDSTQQLFEVVIERLKDIKWVAVEVTLIVIVAFHAFSGIYSIIGDINLSRSVKRVIGVFLLLLYVIFVDYAMWVLTFFIR